MNITNISCTTVDGNTYRVVISTSEGTMRGKFNARSREEAIGYAIIEVAKRTATRIEEN